MHFMTKMRSDEYDEEVAMVVANSLALSRGVFMPETWAPGSIYDEIHSEALRVIVALRKWSN